MTTPIFETRIHDLKGASQRAELYVKHLVSSKLGTDPVFEKLTRQIELINSELQALFPSTEIGHDSLLPSGVLVDDESSVGTLWNILGRPINRSIIQQYLSAADFLAEEDKYPRTTTIYVDWILKPNTTSLEFTKELRNLGFTSIIVATSYPRLILDHYTWISKVIDKSKPWGITDL